ncbi:hypothetical protein ACH4T9_19905 [Micromonospora sp. NPDC020750]|uniref:hypothetical protein n=1 Tax=unclassified Micromonospora TaxID=2617518 RepID=UPI0037929264
MDDGLVCDRCHAGQCWDCEGHCWHGCVSDEYDPDEYVRPSETVELPGVSW